MVKEIDKRNKMVVLSLGGNIGDVKKVFSSSIKSLEERVGRLIMCSSTYKTKAWGFEGQPDFLNMVIVMDTHLLPHEVLNVCLTIEKEEGRRRLDQKKWQKRVIDIDVLFYEKEVIDTLDLVIPHPYIQDRNFVLFPLVELIPDFKHPLLNKTMLELKKSCSDKLQVVKSLA